MSKKKEKICEIKNLKIQLFYNSESTLQGMMAYFTCNGKKMERPVYLVKVKNAPTSYYLKEAKKHLDELNKRGKLAVSKSMVVPLNFKTVAIAATTLLCTIGISVGVTLAIVKAQADTVSVTFDAGIANFKDGSRIKTLKVARGSKLSDIPHDFPFLTYDETNGYNCTTKMWVTDDGTIIDETLGATDYKINSDVYLFADYRDDLSNTKSIAAGYIGNMATEAIARQPEAENKILNTMQLAFSWLDTVDDGYEAVAIGTATGFAVEGIARQPEAEDKINRELMLGFSNLRSMPNDSRTLGLGLMLGQAVEGIARQPEATDKISRLVNLVYREAKKCESAAGGYSMGYGPQQAVEGIARQPEAEGKITESVLEAIDYINQSDDTYESFAIGRTLTEVAEGIARQPEADMKIRLSARIAYSAFHALPNDGRVDGLGDTAGGAATGIARQPEAMDKIISTAAMIYDAAKYVDSPLKGQGLGNAGDAATEAVARQPEAEVKIKKALYYTIQQILKA